MGFDPVHWVDGWQRAPTESLASWYPMTGRVASSRPSSGTMRMPVLIDRVPSISSAIAPRLASGRCSCICSAIGVLSWVFSASQWWVTWSV